MAFAQLFARAPQGDTLVNQAVIPDDRRFPNHDPHPVVNKDPLANRGPWMDVNAGEEAAQVGNQPGNECDVMAMQPVGQTVEGDRMEPRITAQHL